MSDQKEVIFYSDGQGVKVTNTRCVLGNTTYAMANITSVKTDKIAPNYGGPWAVALPGLGILALGIYTAKVGLSRGGVAFVLFGLFFLGIAMLWAWLLKPEFHLRISSAAGETSALSSWDKAYIEKIDQAIREAIIHRG